ncbi:hypothetical protein H0H93_016350, partial [Arthromyces matolae]
KNMNIDEASVKNAFNVFDREGEYCRNYNCCGHNLPDLHALLEHFEEVHVKVDPSASASITIPFNPQPLPPFEPDDMELELDLDNNTHPRSSPSSSSSPPHTPNHPTILAHFNPAYPQFQVQSPYTSAQSSPYTSQPPSPGSAHPQIHFPGGTHPNHVMAHPEEVFNAYARFSADYSSHMPGTQFNNSGGDEIPAPQNPYIQQPTPQQSTSPGQQCIPPALLFSSTNPSTSSSPNSPPSQQQQQQQQQPANKLKLKVRGASGSSTSTPPTPSSSTGLTPFSSNNATSSVSHTAPSTPTSHTPLPAAPSLLLSKPFRCPKPNCNKSYKQANGLKYHMTHGSCNFAPPKDLEHVKDLLERKRREREAAAAGANATTSLARSASLGARPSTSPTSSSPMHPSPSTSSTHPTPEFLQLQGLYTDLGIGGLGGITEHELREVEREAERRLKPFACGVGDCTRRYKNMNGLRYHYQHSGEHGAVGLALLAGGVHECLGHGKGRSDKDKERERAEERVKEEEREREGRRRGAHALRGVGALRGGAVSVPVSRATSLSRVGTPAPTGVPTLSVPAPSLQKSVSFPATTTSSAASATTVTEAFTPTYTNPVMAGQIGVVAAEHAQALQNHNPDHHNHSPPMTPLTSAVQGLVLGGGSTPAVPLALLQHATAAHPTTTAIQEVTATATIGEKTHTSSNWEIGLPVAGTI